MFRCLLTVLLFVFFCPCVPAQSVSTHGVLIGGDSMRYVRVLPEGYGGEDTVRWPLLLFLHGGGSSGEEIGRVRYDVLVREVEERGYPLVVLAPQNRSVHGFWDLGDVERLLGRFVEEHRVDTGRIYLSGASRGGLGAWMLAMQLEDTFAALAPVCGAVPHPYHVWVPDELPIWVFHGADDTAIPTSESVEMVEILRGKGRSGETKITLYEGVGHEAWEHAYTDKELFNWLLTQRK